MKNYTTKKGIKGVALSIHELPPRSHAAYMSLRDAKANFSAALAADLGVPADSIYVSQRQFMLFVTQSRGATQLAKAGDLKRAFARTAIE